MNAVEIYRNAESDLEHNRITLGEFDERIKPLTDVEHVVRCKDCKYWQTNTQFCTRWSAPFATQHTSQNWYCADAERKDGDGDADGATPLPG